MLTPEGRILVGFDARQGPRTSRDYPRRASSETDAESRGLVVQHEFGAYELAPAGGDYVVAVLRRAR